MKYLSFVMKKCFIFSKVFNCPANLASHRRWHKPKGSNLLNSPSTTNKIRQSTMDDSLLEKESLSEDIFEGIFSCTHCGKTFRRYFNNFNNDAIRTYSDFLNFLEVLI